MKALLDANVLYPTILREILIDAAKAKLFEPFWSLRILSEWQHAAARLGDEQARIAGAEIALLQSLFPNAILPDDGMRLIDVHLPDPADRHVLESALATGEKIRLITANLQDFPRRILAPLDLMATHPDAFLVELFHDNQEMLTEIISSARDKAARMGGDMTVAKMLKRSRLPRLAKALKG